MKNQPVARPSEQEANVRLEVTFPDTRKTADLMGDYDKNLIFIENKMGVMIGARSTKIQIEGLEAKVKKTEFVLRELYRKIECGYEITEGLIEAEIRMAKDQGEDASINGLARQGIGSIKTRKKTIYPRSLVQGEYIAAMQREDVVFALGPAGTGKTYLAVAQAVSELITGKVTRLIFSRPAVEAGERLGFLPGDMKEKVDPYLRPIYDALYDCLPPEQVERRIASGEIEVAPLAFMRGRTLANSFIILDEAQNTTKSQMKMFLTRFGENSRMIICGDPNQTDLPGGSVLSGLNDACERLEGTEGIKMIRFGSEDVVRHAIVGRIVKAYEG